MKQLKMKTDNYNIEHDFGDSILTKYLESVINNTSINNVIEKISYKLQMITEDGDTQILDAINKNKIEYIILVTKLTTMIEVFSHLKNDKNLVTNDEMEIEINRFKDLISSSIEKSKLEILNK